MLIKQGGMLEGPMGLYKPCKHKSRNSHSPASSFTKNPKQNSVKKRKTKKIYDENFDWNLGTSYLIKCEQVCKNRTFSRGLSLTITHGRNLKGGENLETLLT